MTKDEFIARQAMKIGELEIQIKNMDEGMTLAMREMICIGGPLNDNKLGYTKEQLLPFFRIQSALDGRMIERIED